MNDRTFLDTNVFVYSFDPSSPSKARKADYLISSAVESRKGIVSYQVVQEFFNLAFRRFEKPMSASEASDYLAKVFRPLLSIHSSERLYARAIQIFDAHHLSWYDSLIVAAAVESGCGILLTEDLNDGQRFGDTMVRNPFA